MSETSPPPSPSGAAAPTDQVALVSLVLGIASLAACQVLGPFAVILGWVAYKRANAEGRQMDPMAIIGLALGAVSTSILVMMGLMFGLMCLFYALFIAFYIVMALVMLVVGAASA